MAASIVVNIEAQITNLRKVLDEMQREVSKVNVGSSIGQQLRKELESARKEVESLGKNLTPRLTSESRIDTLTDKIERATDKVKKLIQTLSETPSKDIIGGLGEEFDSLTRTATSLANEINRIKKGKLSELLPAGELKDFFEQNVKNFKKLDEESANAVFEKAFLKADEHAEKLKTTLIELQSEFEQLSVSFGDFEKKSESILGTNIEELTKNFSAPLREMGDYESWFNDFKESIKNLFPGEKYKEQAKDTISLVEQELNGINVENAREKLKNVFDILTTLKTEYFSYDSATAEDFISRKIFTPENAEKAFIIDYTKERQEQLSNLVTKYKDDLGWSDKDVEKFLTGIDGNSIQRAALNFIKKLETAQADVQTRLELGREVLNKKREGVIDAEKAWNLAEADKIGLTFLKGDYDKFIANLPQRIDALETRLAQIESDRGKIQNQAKNDIDKNIIQGNQTLTYTLDAAKTQAQQLRGELKKVQEQEKLLGKIEGIIQRWFSVYATVRMVTNAIKSVINVTKELDKTITEIAIVTSMTQDDLWKQMRSYTDMARQYASSISGVYKVSQLYYQQGG